MKWVFWVGGLLAGAGLVVGLLAVAGLVRLMLAWVMIERTLLLDKDDIDWDAWGGDGPPAA